jgi:serine/threonine protein kinase
MLVGPLDKCPVCEMQTLNLSVLPQRAEIPADASVVGQEFGGCEVHQVVSRDACSLTCRAVQVSLNRPATLKLFPLSKTLLPHIRQTVHAARKVASVNHPAIAQIFKVGVRDQILFIAVQVGEKTLRDRLKAVTPAEAIPLFRQISEGLRFAHNEGLIHGDLKPEHVYIDEKGQCKITNFGLPIGAEEESTCRFYWPPERWLAKDIDARADMYSLGVIFYELLCGVRPFEVQEPEKLMFAHVNLPPAPPQQVRPGVPRELGHIVLKLLEKDPESRYATAKDLLDDLQRFESKSSVKAHEERGKKAVCKLCETENSIDEIYCTFCKEPLSGKRPEVTFAESEHEFICNVCKRRVDCSSAACGNCMNPVCRCRKGTVTGASGLCPTCEAARPPDKGLLKKMTDFFRKKK